MLVFLLGLLASTAALAAPNLSSQSSWGDAEKKEFLDFLATGRGAPVEGQVKEVPASSSSEPFSYPKGYGRKPIYFSLEGVTNVFTVGPDTDFSYGPRLLFGGHLYSWVRYFTGFEYLSRGAESHVQIPFGIELALIPLGAPHTQYLVLRAGLGAHLFTTPDAGMQGSWNLGLGYEWQVNESGLRVHALAEGQRGFGSTRFSSLGLTAGVSYMF